MPCRAALVADLVGMRELQNGGEQQQPSERDVRRQCSVRRQHEGEDSE